MPPCALAPQPRALTRRATSCQARVCVLAASDRRWERCLASVLRSRSSNLPARLRVFCDETAITCTGCCDGTGDAQAFYSLARAGEFLCSALLVVCVHFFLRSSVTHRDKSPQRWSRQQRPDFSFIFAPAFIPHLRKWQEQKDATQVRNSLNRTSQHARLEEQDCSYRLYGGYFIVRCSGLMWNSAV